MIINFGKTFFIEWADTAIPGYVDRNIIDFDQNFRNFDCNVWVADRNSKIGFTFNPANNIKFLPSKACF